MREIKFRAWDIEKKRMLPPWSIWKSNLFGYEDACNLNLMQYTGIKDKNGKEIFEGDILNLFKFAENHLYLENYTIDNFCENVVLLNSYDGTFKIIGNIYENPELLEVDKQLDTLSRVV